jgi:hypothetical protein
MLGVGSDIGNLFIARWIRSGIGVEIGFALRIVIPGFGGELEGRIDGGGIGALRSFRSKASARLYWRSYADSKRSCNARTPELSARSRKVTAARTAPEPAEGPDCWLVRAISNSKAAV